MKTVVLQLMSLKHHLVCLHTTHIPNKQQKQEAKAYCREVVGFLRTLKADRDMGPAEAKLVVAIESPEARERRKLGIEVRAYVCACVHVFWGLVR